MNGDTVNFTDEAVLTPLVDVLFIDTSATENVLSVISATDNKDTARL